MKLYSCQSIDASQNEGTFLLGPSCNFHAWQTSLPQIIMLTLNFTSSNTGIRQKMHECHEPNPQLIGAEIHMQKYVHKCTSGHQHML